MSNSKLASPLALMKHCRHTTKNAMQSVCVWHTVMQTHNLVFFLKTRFVIKKSNKLLFTFRKNVSSFVLTFRPEFWVNQRKDNAQCDMGIFPALSKTIKWQLMLRACLAPYQTISSTIPLMLFFPARYKRARTRVCNRTSAESRKFFFKRKKVFMT